MKQIQDEYQSFMEGVRGRAQGAIDQANALFQAYRGDATSSLDAAIHYLQSRFFSFSVGLSLPFTVVWVDWMLGRFVAAGVCLLGTAVRLRVRKSGVSTR